MKKTLKITTVGLVIFALVANLHSAMFSFYGIKTNNLEGAIWANSLSTTSGSSSGSSSGSGSTTSGAVWHSPIPQTVKCGAMQYSGTTSSHGAATVATTTSAGVVTVTVSYATVSTSSYSGTIAAHDAKMVQCIGPTIDLSCWGTSAQEACQ